MGRNVADRGEVSQDNKLIKARDYRLERDFSAVLGMPKGEGRRVLQHLIEQCHVDDDIALDGAQTYKAIGMRKAGLYIRGLVRKVDPALLLQMERELEEKPAFLQDTAPVEDDAAREW